MPGKSELESLIHIHLTMVRQPTKRGFAGTGQSRRREKTSARSIAQSIVTGVRVNHRFGRNGMSVADAEVIALLEDELWKVSESTARDLVAIDTNQRDDARDAIVQRLFAALTDNFECSYFRPPYRGMNPYPGG